MAGPPAQPADRLLAPFRDFMAREASGGVVLMAAALIALVWANSPFADTYDALWGTTFTIGAGDFVLAKSLHLWINDGLMAIFFLVVGLEIKREVLVGELASARRAILPIAAAGGGAILPAILFLLVAGGDPAAARGWGVPMATDIAFALGVLALLGSRVPVGLRIFLTALAIADDLLAVLVIAIFYSSDLSLIALAVAGGVLGALVIANRLGVRRPIVYGVLGIALWIAVLQSGIHATVAGVLLAMTIPARTRPDTPHPSSPMLVMEHALHPWVAFLIVPLFALSNAGVRIGGDVGALASEPVVLGVVFGLVVGKQVGITLAAWLVVRLGLAALPNAVTWRHIYGAAWLGGIGFTMSLFVADLAFGGSATLDLAKIGILGASVVAGTGGYLILRSAGSAR